MAAMPVIPIHDLDPAELRTYALADNRIAQNAVVITPEEEKLEKLPEATVSRSQRIAQEKLP
ncbi:hypothetical protein TomTYG75_10330 [Sphingobium sp. TomTYG75]